MAADFGDPLQADVVGKVVQARFAQVRSVAPQSSARGRAHDALVSDHPGSPRLLVSVLLLLSVAAPRSS
jgi:hypothetical protein